MTHNFVYEECQKNLQKRKEDIPNTCKILHEREDIKETSTKTITYEMRHTLIF
jgi:hypothetical protein